MAELNDLRTVLDRCGIAPVATRDLLIAAEGFTSIASLGVLETDQDVTDMAKRLQSRTQAEGRVLLGTVQIKNLQALAYWVRDKQMRGQAINVNDWTAAGIADVRRTKGARKEAKEAQKEPSVKDLGTFDPVFFETYEEAFLNLLAQTTGALGEPIRYVVRPAVAPAEFENDAQERMFQLPLTGEAYELDNGRVYRKLKEFLVDTPGAPWIEQFNASENGRAAYLAWTTHYNGVGELNKRVELAKTKLDTTYYKNESQMSFERYTGIQKKCIQTISKDPDQALSPRQQVEKLLLGIRCDNTELVSAKQIISSQHADDYDAAVAYYSAQVSRIYGAAQLQHQRYRPKRNVSALYQQGRGRGGGGRGRGRGRGELGQYQRPDGGHSINGVDISDPRRDFSDDEWNQLGREGRAFIFRKREEPPRSARGDRGRGRGRGGRGRDNRAGRGGGGGGGRGANVGALHQQQQGQGGQQQDQQQETGQRGGQSGRGFGRGAYTGRGSGGE